MDLFCSRLLVVLAILLFLVGCRDMPADRLYALSLDHPPTAADWERALPRTVTVKGGRLHKLVLLPEIDADTVHTSTASCHHGAALPDPLPVDMRAFYTRKELFLRLSWPDSTRDEGIMEWRFDGEKWVNSGGMEDGFGLLWDVAGHFPRFTCAVACHLHDFGVSRGGFRASNKMKLAKKEEWLDFWNWKAQRTSRYGFADDRYLDSEGMHGNVSGELFVENSRTRLEKGDLPPFAEGDAPIYDAEGLPVVKKFRPAGSTAPGYLTERPTGGRADVAAFTTWANGRWTVILRRALETGDHRDATFMPGGKALFFGLSVMDHTLNEHYASVTEESIVLLPVGNKKLAEEN